MDKKLNNYKEAFEDIPGTRVFTTERARQGYWLNQFCMTLMLLDLGGNIYYLAKVFSTDGLSFVQAVSTMTGMNVDDYKAMMSAGGRSPDGVRSIKENN